MESLKKKDTVLLLIENDRIISTINTSLDTRFTYTIANNSVEAFSKMTFNIPSLIIADIDLDNTTVLKFLKTIRKGIKTKLIPFIILSSSNNRDNRIKAIEYGVDAFLQYPFIPEELNAVVHSMLNKFKEFYLMTITDELTRLYNRKEFIKKFNDEILEAKQKGVSLAILDIDHFKGINDIYGHQTGDIVLMKLAKILREYSSKSFFPARFGGEEFVVLFPDIKIKESSKILKRLLHEFSSTEFEINKKVFHVTFSAGLSEYPSMGINISELLARADQALYAAKNDGRNLVYTFNPIMARNDKFWEYLKTKKNLFVHDGSNEVITQLPYLPQILNTISNLDFDVQSIGVLIFSLRTIYDIDAFIGYTNLAYVIENIKRIIIRSTELIFPSDTHTGISDLYGFEFVILFPSVVDFSFNLIKFKDICKEISMIINENLNDYPVDISYSNDVTLLNVNNPRKLLFDIDSIRKNQNFLSDKHRLYTIYQKSFRNIAKLININDFIKLKSFYDSSFTTPSFHYFSMKKPFEYLNVFDPIIQEQFDSVDKLKKLLNLCYSSFHKKITKPLLFPFMPHIYPESFVKTLYDEFHGKEIIIMMNEHFLNTQQNNSILPMIPDLPKNISIGVNNCYISNEILHLLAKYNFHILAFSENIVRNLNMFKNRIKIISGLTLFLEQIAVPSLAYNIQSETEFQIINDLHIRYTSGHYTDHVVKLNKRHR